jgi:insecticidal toxin complex protein TccC
MQDDFRGLHAQTPSLSVMDPRGLIISSVGWYRTVVDQDASPRTERYEFDVAGRKAYQSDARLSTATQASPNLSKLHSLSGQVLARISVDSGWLVSLPGEAGQMVKEWDGRGIRRRVEYDSMLRPMAVFEGDGADEVCAERLTYGTTSDSFANQCGQLIRHDDPAGSLGNLSFNLTGEVIKQTRRFLIDLDLPDWPLLIEERDDLLELAKAESTWRFDPLGDVLEQTDAKGNMQSFAQTVAGQLKASNLLLRDQAAGMLLSDIQYDAQGRIASETAGNGVVTALDYDPVDGRLIRLRAGDGHLQDLNYAYDPVGNVVSIEDRAQPTRHFANQRIEPLRTFAYDTLYQLIKATGYEAAAINRGPCEDLFQVFPAANELSNYTQQYEYDAGGNLQTLVHVGAQNHTRSFATSQISNRSLLQTAEQPPSEEQITAGFDAAGNLRELQPGQVLSWDLRNQLSQVTPVKRESAANDSEVYRYDAAGMRVRKVRTSQARTVTHLGEVRYLPGLEIRSNTATGEELHVVTVTAGHSNVRVLHWQSSPPANVANDQIRYSLTDHLGSSTLELDDDAQLISQEIYYPYGETAWFAGRSEVEAKYKTVRYSGKERDATGLYYYGLRYYAPWLMRWINPDPAGEADGVNFFVFVRNSPLVLVDPNGAGSTEPDSASIPNYATRAYDLMIKQGRVWSGLGLNHESGFQTVARLSSKNIAVLKDEIDTESQRKLAARIQDISPDEAWITHFSEADFSTEHDVYFKTLATLQEERNDTTYEGHSEGGNITEYANHDFVFFAWEAGGSAPTKTRSRFGEYRYHASFAELGQKADYTYLQVSDLMRPNSRDLTRERARTLGWLGGHESTDAGFLDFKNRSGLRENTEADLLFMGSDMLKGLGHKVAVDLSSLSEDTQEAVVEWASNDRPLLNVSEIVNAFFRPQVVVPGGLYISDKRFSVQRIARH